MKRYNTVALEIIAVNSPEFEGAAPGCNHYLILRVKFLSSSHRGHNLWLIFVIAIDPAHGSS